MKQTKDRSISIRLSDQMLKELDSYAEIEAKDRAEVIRKAIAAYLDISDGSVECWKTETNTKVSWAEDSIRRHSRWIASTEERMDLLENKLEEVKSRSQP